MWWNWFYERRRGSAPKIAKSLWIANPIEWFAYSSCHGTVLCTEEMKEMLLFVNVNSRAHFLEREGFVNSRSLASSCVSRVVTSMLIMRVWLLWIRIHACESLWRSVPICVIWIYPHARNPHGKMFMLLEREGNKILYGHTKSAPSGFFMDTKKSAVTTIYLTKSNHY